MRRALPALVALLTAAVTAPAAAECKLDPGDGVLGVEVRLQRDEGGGRWVDRTWAEAPKPGERLRLAVHSSRTLYLAVWVGQEAQARRPTLLWPPPRAGVPDLLRGGSTVMVPPGDGAFVIDGDDARWGWTLVMAPKVTPRAKNPWRARVQVRAVVDEEDSDRLCLHVPDGMSYAMQKLWRWR